MAKSLLNKTGAAPWYYDSVTQNFGKEIRISRISVSVYQIINWLKKDELKYDMDKRLFNKWSLSKKSYYIESILIRFPSSYIYLCEERDGTRSIVDGYNRISSLIEFVNNEFRLTNLNSMKNLNNCCFDDLEYNIQRRFLDSTLDLCIINSDCSPSSKYDIFKRVNGLTSKMMQSYLYYVSKPGFRNVLSRMGEIWKLDFPNYFKSDNSVYYKMNYQELSVSWLSCVLAYWLNDVPDEAFTLEHVDSLNNLSVDKLKTMYEDFEHSVDLAREFINSYHSAMIINQNNALNIVLLWSIIFQIWKVADQHFGTLIRVFDQVMASDNKAKKILQSSKVDAEKLFYVIKKISDLLELRQR